MNNDISSIDSLVDEIKRNTNFLEKLLTPKIGFSILIVIFVIFFAVKFM
jgi:hypothetical protein